MATFSIQKAYRTYLDSKGYQCKTQNGFNIVRDKDGKVVAHYALRRDAVARRDGIVAAFKRLRAARAA